MKTIAVGTQVKTFESSSMRSVLCRPSNHQFDKAEVPYSLRTVVKITVDKETGSRVVAKREDNDEHLL